MLLDSKEASLRVVVLCCAVPVPRFKEVCTQLASRSSACVRDVRPSVAAGASRKHLRGFVQSLVLL